MATTRLSVNGVVQSIWRPTAAYCHRRALVNDPRILIFRRGDQVLSITRVSEHYSGQYAAYRGRAHRHCNCCIAYSTVRRSDHIVTIERGRVVERGSHHELLRTGGRYADLHNPAGRSSMKSREATAVPGSNVIVLGKRPSSARPRTNFCLAALEILETPASPLEGASRCSNDRAVLRCRIRLGLFRTCRRHPRPPGKIVPTGRSKVIQPLEPGIRL